MCQWYHASDICLSCQITHIVNQSVEWNPFRWILETTPSYPFNGFWHRFSMCHQYWIGICCTKLCLPRSIHSKFASLFASPKMVALKNGACHKWHSCGTKPNLANKQLLRKIYAHILQTRIWSAPSAFLLYSAFSHTPHFSLSAKSFHAQIEHTNGPHNGLEWHK